MIEKLVSLFIVVIICFIPVSVDCAEKDAGIQDDAEITEAVEVTEETELSDDTEQIRENRLTVNAPANVKAIGKDYNKIRISWNSVQNATGYKVYRWNQNKGKYVCIKTIKNGKTTSYINSGLNIKSRYSYKVAAYVKADGKTIISMKSRKAVGWTLKSYKGISLVKPVKKMNLVSGYGSRGGSLHIGADYAAPKGTAVYAAASGTVIKSKSNYGGLGEGIVIRHSKGLVTWYGHLNSRKVKAGDRVKAGDKIGTVGSTGNATLNHLHFEVWINGKTYNPQKFF